MKNVLGGKLQTFNCTIYYSNGSTMSGSVQADSLDDASSNLTTNIINHPGVYGDPSYWTCQ